MSVSCKVDDFVAVHSFVSACDFVAARVAAASFYQYFCCVACSEVILTSDSRCCSAFHFSQWFFDFRPKLFSVICALVSFCSLSNVFMFLFCWIRVSKSATASQGDLYNQYASQLQYLHMTGCRRQDVICRLSSAGLPVVHRQACP